VSFGPCALVRAHRVPLERFPGTSFNEILKILCPGSGWSPTIRTRRRCPPSLTSFPFELEKNAVQSAADREDCKDAPICGSFLPFYTQYFKSVFYSFEKLDLEKQNVT